MKLGVIFFHSNIRSIYKDRWVEKSVNSMINQSIKELHYYEINYDGDSYSVLQNNSNISKSFFSKKLKNHVEAMNFILDVAFNDGCDYVFNTNLDDYYHENRVELQLNMMINGGYDLIGTDFCYVRENSEEIDRIILYKNMHQFIDRVSQELNNGHNVISHPSVCYSKKAWDSGIRYDIDMIPSEDLNLWKKLNDAGFKLGILPINLLYYRIHDNQISFK